MPVISVGNLTWGGTGKTPMTEFIARVMDEAGIRPLILSRGYAGGDEAKMLQRHLFQTSARIGIGSNRSATAASLFDRYGCVDSRNSSYFEKISTPCKFGPGSENEKLGVVILDDGLQHWSLLRDVEIIMLNALMPWGNNHFLPRGPLREPFSALGRGDIVVIHHADLVSDMQLKCLESIVQNVAVNLPIFLSRLSPSHLFEVKNQHFRLPLSVVEDKVVLCVSAIGCPNAFIQGVKKIGPLHVDRLDFSDHYFLQDNDIVTIRVRLAELENKFDAKAYIMITEKDYDRDPSILKELDEVLVLCSSFQFLPFRDRTEENFRIELKKLLVKRC